MDKYFFETTHTIEDGVGFELYGTLHLLWLLAFVIICVASAVLYRRMNERSRSSFLWVITGLMLWNEISKYIVLGISDHFRADYLPFHICSINIFVIAAYMIRKREILAEILYAVCLPGALVALLFPSWATLPLTSFMHIHSFTVHTELFLFPLLLIVGGFKPSFKRLLKALPVCLIVVGIMFVFNKIYDTNFMFLNEAGEGNPLTFFEELLGNPMYLIALPPLLGIVWYGLYGVPSLYRKVRDIAKTRP